jgi:circadian clock protein KaiC
MQKTKGKTTFAIQFLLNGVKELGESGVYATFVQSANKLKRDMLSFNWDLAKLESERKMLILDLMQSVCKNSAAANLEIILASVKDLGATRLVIDSLSAMTSYIKTKEEARCFISLLVKVLEDVKCTTLLLVEIPWHKSEIGSGFEEFLADSLIVLETTLERFKIKRRLFIPKMRGTNQSLNCFDFFITSDGISVSNLPSTEH